MVSIAITGGSTVPAFTMQLAAPPMVRLLTINGEAAPTSIIRSDGVHLTCPAAVLSHVDPGTHSLEFHHLASKDGIKNWKNMGLAYTLNGRPKLAGNEARLATQPSKRKSHRHSSCRGTLFCGLCFSRGAQIRRLPSQRAPAHARSTRKPRFSSRPP
jgi:hypothetical protein